MKAVKIVLLLIVVFAVLIAIAWRVPSTVQVSRVFAASPEQIWALWSDESNIAKWWGPTGYTAPTIHSEFKVGGKFLLSMRSPSGEMFWNTGTYLELQSGQRIVQSLSFANDQGQPIPGASAPVPGKWPDQVTVTTEFRAVDGGTEVRIEEAGIPLIMKLFAGMGWQQQFDKIELLLRN